MGLKDPFCSMLGSFNTSGGGGGGNSGEEFIERGLKDTSCCGVLGKGGAGGGGKVPLGVHTGLQGGRGGGKGSGLSGERDSVE